MKATAAPATLRTAASPTQPHGGAVGGCHGGWHLPYRSEGWILISPCERAGEGGGRCRLATLAPGHFVIPSFSGGLPNFWTVLSFPSITSLGHKKYVFNKKVYA